MGIVYDLFGDGKTALKASANKYLAGFGLNGIADSPNPINLLALSTTRQWTDTNKDYVVSCDLTNPAAQTIPGKDVCGAMLNSAFVTQGLASSQFDSKLLTGWGHRPANWEFSAGIQREILPRVSVEFAWFRRIFENFQVTDNLLVTPADYTSYSITAPSNPLLPNGGGYTVSGLVDLNNNKVSQVLNLNTLSDNYGEQTQHWNGFDVNVNTRLHNGVLLQGGVSTGYTVTDDCEVLAKLPEMQVGLTTTGITTTNVLQSQSYCHMKEPWLTQVKVNGSYLVPRVDVQVSGTFQSIPGPALAANFVAANSVVFPSLQRNLSSGQNVTINLITPGTMYGERLNQLDMRFGKIVRYGRTRTTLSLDVYNIFNKDTVLTSSAAYASFQKPQTIIQARFAKISANFEF
jgi:hypothetical protein